MKAPSPSLRPLCQVPRVPLVGSVLAVLLLGSPLSAQTSEEAAARDNWSVALMGGALSYEPSNDASFPAFSLRADTRMADYARVEVEVWYSRPDVQQDADFEYDPSLPAKAANLFALTVGIQFRHAMGPFEPYAGLSAGLFARYDDDSEGLRFSRNTFYFPAGFRLWVSDHLGVRAEYRFREDNHELITQSSTELSAGVFYTF